MNNRKVIKTQRSLAKGLKTEEELAENFLIEHFKETAVRRIITEEATEEDLGTLLSDHPLKHKMKDTDPDEFNYEDDILALKPAA